MNPEEKNVDIYNIDSPEETGEISDVSIAEEAVSDESPAGEIPAAEMPEEKREKPKNERKLAILYVLEVLRKYSDRHHKLTLAEISSLIKQDYDFDCGKKAISRHIRSLIDHGYKISTHEDNGEGYFIGEKEFTPEDAFMLWEGLMSSKYISKEEISHLVEKLSHYCGMDYRFGSSFYGGIVSRHVYPEDFVHENIRILLTEMAENKKVTFVYNEYNKEKIITPTGNKIVVSPYAVVNVDNEYYLAAKEDGGKKGSMSAYKISMITNLETTASIADDIRNVPGYAKGFDVNVFANEFISPFRGESLICHLNVLTEKLSDVIDYFGDTFRIIDEEGEYMLIEFTTNEEKMYKWAIGNADISELIFPQMLRFKVKDYFDINSWKYR